MYLQRARHNALCDTVLGDAELVSLLQSEILLRRVNSRETEQGGVIFDRLYICKFVVKFVEPSYARK
jgi:hypothetical protein